MTRLLRAQPERSTPAASGFVRTLDGFSNFAISFTILSILTGVATMYDYGLSTAGPREMTFGWPISIAGTMLVVLSMAELCSALPTSGAMYDWAATLGGPGWAWFSAWFNILGLVASVAGVDYGCAVFLVPMLGWESKASTLMLVCLAFMVVHGVINHVGIRLVGWLSDLSAVVEMGGVAVIVVALWWLAAKQPVDFLVKPYTSGSIHARYFWLFILGLLQTEWVFCGFDGSAHVAEETVDAPRRAPRGILFAVLVSGFFGYLLVLTITWVIPDLGRVLNAQDGGGHPLPALLAIIELTLGPRVGAAMLVLVVIAMWFCGLSCVTSLSRTLHALARDKGVPLWQVWKRISPTHHTPAAAVWLSIVLSFATLLYSKALSVIASICVLGFYISYFIPIFLGWRQKPQWIAKRGPWNLGRWTNVINLASLIWIVFVCTIMVMPPNTRAAYATAVAVLVLYALHRLSGPHEIKRHPWPTEDKNSLVG